MNARRVLVVDDEQLARGRVVRLLRSLPWVGQIDEAANVQGAIDSIAAAMPDILLLDIQMPDGTGFDLVRRLEVPVPALIFITAFDDHALQAFDASAVDYVTKPIEPGRLFAALERARQAAALKANSERIAELEEVILALRHRSDRQDARGSELWVKSRGEFVRIAPTAISHVQAERDYVRIHAEGREYLHHENLATIEKLLPARDFLRIHRSTIVRIDAVEKVKPGSFSSLVAVLANGTELRVGRTYTADIRGHLTGKA